MKPVILISILSTLFFACKTETKKNNLANTTANKFLNSQYFILEYGEKNRGIKDTLFVNFDNQDAFLILKKDTIAKENSWANATGFISSLGVLGCKNTFLMETYDSDGCPSAYKILAFKDSANYYLSPGFGNCETISKIKIGWPEIEFEFDEFKEAE